MEKHDHSTRDHSKHDHATHERTTRQKIDVQQLGQQLEQLQQYLQHLDTQLNEVNTVKQGLEDFSQLKGDEEILVPLTNGIFFPGKMSSSKKLVVNVGDGTVVEKSLQDTMSLIDKQYAELQEYRQEAFIQFQQLLAHVAMLEMRKEAKK